MRGLIGAALCLAACAAVPTPAVRGMPQDDPASSFSAVWVGHATLLLRFGHRYVLTDPNLGGAVLGVVPRLTPASLRPEELPRVDAVLLSHMHFDHFDEPTLRKLPRDAAVFFPRDGAHYADELRQRRKQGLAPWEQVQVGDLTITAVPARHQGGRYGIDALWNHAACGYVIEGAGHRVYFAGDTGMDPGIFKEIARRFPGIEVAFLPIAPGRGESGRPDHWGHVGPRGALEIFAEVGARYMVPIHFEAFFTSGEHVGDARRALAAEVAARGLQQRGFALRTGERFVLEPDRAPLVLGPRPQPHLASSH